MATPNFAQFAGTLVANGSSPENKAPLMALEKGAIVNYSDIPKVVDGLLSQLTGVIVNPTTVYKNPVTDLFIKSAAEYGMAYEETGYGMGAPDKRSDGTCRQIGNVSLPDPVFHVKNYASHQVLEIFDKEFKQQVFTAEQLATLVANKIRTIAKTEANKLGQAETVILSDVCDGTKNVTSYINSNDPSSTAVYYPEDGASAAAGAVKGYAGDIQTAGISNGVADTGVGSVPSFTTADAVALLKQIKMTARDMSIPSTDFNLAQREIHLEGKPNLVIEKKVMDALNYALMDGDQHKLGGYSDGATAFLQDAVEIKMIDTFGDLPANSALTVSNSETAIDTADYRLGAILADPGLYREVTYMENMETERCMGRRSRIYDFQSEKAIFASTFLPSAAILFEKPSA